MKRIAFLGRGGHTLPTYRALLNRIGEHYDLSVYAEVPVEMAWLALEHNYSIRAVTSRKLPRRIREMLFLGLLIKDHLKKPFDLVHAHSTYPTGFVAVILQKLFRIPAIVSLHAAEGSAFRDIHFGDLLNRNRSIINRWVINQAKVVTVLSAFQKKELERNLGIKRPMIVTHRGVDLKKFFYERRNGTNSPVVFISVGYLNPIKDPETLLYAFQLIQNELSCALIVVGKDYTKGYIHELAGKLGISDKVRFEGYIDHDRINEYYRQADVLLHTSRYESQGMVIAEAMASGVLVIGTNVGLMSDLSGKCCLTVPTRNAKAIAAAVVSLLKDNERMNTMRQNAYAWSKDHSLDACAQEIMSLYRRHVKGQ